MTDDCTIETTNGPVRGKFKQGAFRFGGIQYAGPIDGQARFRAPELPEKWTLARGTPEWAYRVPQVDDPSVVEMSDYHRFLFGPAMNAPMSEEGLFLNLWTPSPDKGARRPVMVWLHGGGFGVGEPSRIREDGTRLAARQDVVVVAPAHRLGANGFLYLDEISGGEVRTANLGMLDIVASLQWVQDNIENFGGDPTNVTVFGESGGGMKVSTLLAMPQAKGLLHRAICQGGILSRGFRFGSQTRQQATETAKSFLASLNGEADYRMIASLDTAQYIKAQKKFGGGIMAWRPVVDGDVLPAGPEMAVQQGTALDVPLLVGNAAHESDFFVGGKMDVGGREALRSAMGDEADAVFDGYRETRASSSDQEIYRAIMTDWSFRMPSIRVAEDRAALSSPVYMYRIDWERTGNPGGRATHGAEVPFVFDTLETTGYTEGREEARALVDQMQGAWAAFARTGNPNHEGIPHIAPYDVTARSTLIFDRRTRVEHDPGAPDRVVWNKLAQSDVSA